VLRAYCHCTQCQRLTGMSFFHYTDTTSQNGLYSGCPFIHTIHFPASAFSWKHDNPVDVLVDPLRPWKNRTRCRACGVAVASLNSKTDRVSVWGPHFARDDSGRVLRWDEVRPTAHIYYGTRLLDINDDLGKWEGYEGESDKIA